MKTHHITKDGEYIKLTDLTFEHLMNIINKIKYLAKIGITITYTNGGGYDDTNLWFEHYTEEIKGKEVLKFFDYSAYINELKRRQDHENKINHILFER